MYNESFSSVYEKRLFVSMSMDIRRNGYDRDGQAGEDIIDRTMDKYADQDEFVAFYGSEADLRAAAGDVADRWFESPHPELVDALIG